jgi:hypothetical protein
VPTIQLRRLVALGFIGVEDKVALEKVFLEYLGLRLPVTIPPTYHHNRIISG